MRIVKNCSERSMSSCWSASRSRRCKELAQAVEHVLFRHPVELEQRSSHRRFTSSHSVRALVESDEELLEALWSERHRQALRDWERAIGDYLPDNDPMRHLGISPQWT